MATQARIDSVDALEFFRSRLIIFVNKARLNNAEVVNEVRRTRSWLQTDQRPHWEREIRRRRKVLDQVQQELLSARMSPLHGDLSGKQTAVRKASRALEEAEDKLRKVREWIRNFDSTMDPLVHRLESLNRLIDFKMPKGIVFLTQAQRAIAAYLETAPSSPILPSPEETKLP